MSSLGRTTDAGFCPSITSRRSRDRGAAHRLHVVGDDGQRRIQQRKPLDVVEGDEGHVPADAQALPVQGGQRSDGHGAVGCQQRGRRLRETQQVVRSGRTAGGLEVAEIRQGGVGAEPELTGRRGRRT